MSKYSKLAGRRYRLYEKEKQRHYLFQKLVAFMLWILHALSRAAQQAGVKKHTRVQKVSVELE
ncbi:MAG: hypothetical protein M3115_02620 [Thermoproteota archaeon]|nr:hypothetical protein [Thermoproteota archaeon]